MHNSNSRIKRSSQPFSDFQDYLFIIGVAKTTMGSKMNIIVSPSLTFLVSYSRKAVTKNKKFTNSFEIKSLT